MARDWETWMWQHAEDLLNEADRIRRGFLETAIAARRDPLLGNASWGPPVNVIETEEAFWILASLPGVDADDVSIEIGEGVLTIEGRRGLPKELAAGRPHIIEIPCGRFARRVQLPEGRFELGNKTLSQGVLWIELRKVR